MTSARDSLTSGRRSAPSVRRRVLTGLGALGVLLMVTVGAAGFWVVKAAEEFRTGLSLISDQDRLVGEFSASVLRELYTSHQYVITRDALVGEAFRDAGFETFRLYEELLRTSGRNPETAVVVASLLSDLAIAEALLARAQRLADLGLDSAAQADLVRATPRTESLTEGLARLASVSAAARETSTRRLVNLARQGAAGLIVIILVGLAVAVGAATGSVRSLVRAVADLTAHADELKQGHLERRVETESLPEELQSLGAALNDASQALTEQAENERQLREAERLSAIGLLVSGMAHELNNPLAIILMSADDLVGRVEPDALRTDLEEIRDQARRARGIVRQLLSTVRDDAVEPGEDVSPDEALSRYEAELTRMASEGGCTLSVEIAPDLPRVPGGMTGFGMVVSSLTDNAVAACGPGGQISVGLTVDDADVVLTVEDDGPGVPPELRGRIFDPFVTTRGDAGHPGLGLSVVHGLLRRVGGSIRVGDRLPEGGGARFEARFPARGSRADDVASEVSATPPAAAPPASGREGNRGRLLIVDDERPIRRMLRKVFERQGWEVDDAADGREAHDMVVAAEDDGRAYQVIVSDLKMPEMTGMELVDRLVAEVPGVQSRFVIMTGDHVAAGPAQFLERTGLPMVSKPFEVVDLVAAVDEVVGRSDSASDADQGEHA